MAEVVQQQILPAPFIEAAAKPYLQELTTAVGGLKAADLSKSLGSQFIAGQDPLQAQAQTLATQGIGAYQPFLTSAAASAGPTAYQQFMSPYQQDIIDTTLAEFDVQSAKGIPGIAAQAVGAGVLGGGREGVMRSEYQSNQDANRALIQSKLLQQGFNQSNLNAQTAFNQQGQLGQNIQDFQTADINQLGRLGGLQQAQSQAVLDAQREANRLEAFEPYERLGTYGSGVASLFSGNAPFGNQSTITPNATPLQTALGTASVLSGIFGGRNVSDAAYKNI